MELERLKEVYEVLSKNKLRTFLTAFGVGWGILMLVIIRQITVITTRFIVLNLG